MTASLRNKRSVSARLGLLAIALAIVMTPGRGGAIAVSDPLSFDRGFLLTGNYVVGGVDFTPQNNTSVNGIAEGTIRFDSLTLNNGVPPNSDIVAAYLYWEAIYLPGANPTAGVKFRGFPIDPNGDFAAASTETPSDVAGLKAVTLSPLPSNVATCWGAAGSPDARLTMFRFDVLHLLPQQDARARRLDRKTAGQRR